jgi:histidyl-tRNA synthetase
MSAKALPGFRDFYPQEFAERAHIVGVWREVARRYGFVEYDGPPLEPLDLYTRKSGDEIVGQLYNFVDKGDRPVSLRPEMTPTFARMVAAKASALRKPVRWFSVPQLFRYERQQKGRLREHFQLNVDIVGEADVTADAELLAAAIDIMRAVGLKAEDVRARVSDRRLLSALLENIGVTDTQLPAAFAVVDKLEREPRDVSTKRLADAGLDEQTRTRFFDYVRPMSVAQLREHFGGDSKVAEPLERIERYFGYLDSLGVREWAELDLTIVRGLAYYTGIVFELFDRKGEFRAICGGGRYDTLLQSLGGVDLPALGFGMGDVVLAELLRARGLMPASAARIDYWVAGDDEAGQPDVMRVAAALRARGRSVEFALRPQTLSRQLKTAVAAGAERAVILRGDDAGRGTATIRTLGDGGEALVTLAEWLPGA